jgi:hypothetical protein
MKRLSRMRAIYTWSGGALQKSGAVSEPHLRAWEYEIASDAEWKASDDEDETVRLWRTRRPDLAPPELWVGDREA